MSDAAAVIPDPRTKNRTTCSTMLKWATVPVEQRGGDGQLGKVVQEDLPVKDGGGKRVMSVFTFLQKTEFACCYLILFRGDKRHHRSHIAGDCHDQDKSCTQPKWAIHIWSGTRKKLFK